MKIEGSHTFSAPREIVWPVLLDPEILSNVLPGCEKLEPISENEYRGVLNIRVGPVQGKFNGVVTMSEINAPEGYHFDVSGKGAPGFVNGNGKLRLEANGHTTTLIYDGDAQVGGRIASVGQRLLDTSVRAIIRQTLEGLDNQIQAITQAKTAGSGSTAPPPPTVAPPTQTQFATGVLKNMFEEFLPPEQRDEVVFKAILLLGVVLVLSIIDQWRINRIAKRVAKIIRKGGRI